MKSLTPASQRRRAATYLWIANIAFGVLLAANLLTHVPEEPRLWGFALPALVSSVILLTLPVGGLFVLLAGPLRSPRLLQGLQAGLWTLFQVLLFADTRIYNMFRYHFNGQVLNLVYTRGSEDAIHLGWQVWTSISLGLVAVSLAEAWLWRAFLRHSAAEPTARPSRLPRPAWIWITVLLPTVFIDKTIYAEADLARDHELTSLARLFPLYTRIPAEDLANLVRGVETKTRIEVPESSRLHYPLAVPTLHDGPRPNVLFVVVDCLRKDLLNETHAPHMTRWAEDSRRFENHLSGGNSTRYGIFSMLYGLYGSYWFPFLQARRSPVLVDVLADEGYTMGVFSSASMNYPELRDTAWSGISRFVHDDYPADEPWRRDELAAADLVDWLTAREADGRPFFGFLLLDAPHQTYSHPPDVTPFTPSATEVDYMALTQNDGPDPAVLESVRNRYLNAVYHADTVAGTVLEHLAASPLLDDTLVIVTGDHGEEFRECGFFGHTSAYTPPQVAVPFVLRGPGVTPGIEDRPTSHLDVAPTLLELMGADPEIRGAWTLGQNLLSPPATRRRVISGWNELGVWAPGGILRVPLSPFDSSIEVYDYRWNLLTNPDALLTEEEPTLHALEERCNRFLD